MTLADYAIRHAPDLAPGQFARILADADSPAAPEADAMEAALVAAGVSPAVALAFFRHESSYGRLGIAADYATRSMGNVRTPFDLAYGGTLINVPGRGQFARYPTWAAGAADWAARLLGPIYAGRGLHTVRAVLPVYAPTGDGNNPTRYADAVLADVARWTEEAAMAFEYPGYSQGAFAAPPTGIILHGTRGGNADRAQEFLGTCRWVTSNPDGLAWHVTIGDGVYAQHLPAGEWGWHAREHSRTYLGVEFVQPTVDDAITDEQVVAFARWYRAVALPVWPHLGLAPVLPGHSEMPAGKRDGKADPFPRGDGRLDELVRRLHAALAPTASYTVGAGVLAAMARAGDTPTSNEDYIANGLSVTSGRAALYLYHAASDGVYVAARA